MTRRQRRVIGAGRGALPSAPAARAAARRRRPARALRCDTWCEWRRRSIRPLLRARSREPRSAPAAECRTPGPRAPAVLRLRVARTP
eukprot:scaffold1237_cov403-Prasinococcus_capsulatus_cf.AAC.1